MSVSVAATSEARLGAWKRWAALLDEREPGTSLALFRIACGLCVLASVGSVVLHGLVPTYWLNPADGGYTDVAEPRLFKYLGGVQPQNVWLVVAVCLLSALGLALGLASRLNAFLALQSYMALTGLNPAAGGAYDWLLTNALW